MVQINKIDVERCFELEDNLPVSRKSEQELNKHYNIPGYWAAEQKNHDRNTPADNYQLPPEVEKLPGTMIRGNDIGTNIRSYKEAIGYFEYTKIILGKVSFSKSLFRKELEKSFQYLNPSEISKLHLWCKDEFIGKYPLVINEVFYGKKSKE